MLNLFNRYAIYRIHNPHTSDFYYELLSYHTFSAFAKRKALSYEIKLGTSDIYIIPTYIKPALLFDQFIK